MDIFHMEQFRCVELFSLLGYILCKHFLHKKVIQIINYKTTAQKLVWKKMKMLTNIFICKHLMIYTSFLTNNPQTWSTNFKCFISPCIYYTVVFKWRTVAWDILTTFPCSCFIPLLDIMRTWFHFSSCCCWVFAFSRIYKNL